MTTTRKRPNNQAKKPAKSKTARVTPVSAKQAASIKGGGRRDLDQQGYNHNQTLRSA